MKFVLRVVIFDVGDSYFVDNILLVIQILLRKDVPQMFKNHQRTTKNGYKYFECYYAVNNESKTLVDLFLNFIFSRNCEYVSAYIFHIFTDWIREINPKKKKNV